MRCHVMPLLSGLASVMLVDVPVMVNKVVVVLVCARQGGHKLKETFISSPRHANFRYVECDPAGGCDLNQLCNSEKEAALNHVLQNKLTVIPNLASTP